MQPSQHPIMNPRLQNVRSELVSHLLILGSLICILWLVEIFDQLFWRETLDFYGIQPRTSIGLRNILLAPFLHKGFNHLIANTAPFLVLGWFVLLRGVQRFFGVSLIAAVVSGLGVWLLGRPATIHVGLSGVIFGYLGFLLFRGYFERSSQAIALALIAGFLYGSMIWGVLPLQPNVSWLGHLFGFLGGAWAARQLSQ
ncbi:MAG: rhomboid family intramembrane serine protease [Caldilineaceae bacterium]